jgi:hypothetical protein
MTEVSELAEKYVELGGKRKSVMDDNKVSTRLWADESAAAAAFWQQRIASLPADKLKELETLLPSISGDSR